jgi:hypothetical protein
MRMDRMSYTGNSELLTYMGVDGGFEGHSHEDYLAMRPAERAARHNACCENCGLPRWDKLLAAKYCEPCFAAELIDIPRRLVLGMLHTADPRIFAPASVIRDRARALVPLRRPA